METRDDGSGIRCNEHPDAPAELTCICGAVWEGEQMVHAPRPREWVGLTDEEIMEMLDYGQYGRVPQYARNFVDAIEAKLKEKNT